MAFPSPFDPDWERGSARARESLWDLPLEPSALRSGQGINAEWTPYGWKAVGSRIS